MTKRGDKLTQLREEIVALHSVLSNFEDRNRRYTIVIRGLRRSKRILEERLRELSARKAV